MTTMAAVVLAIMFGLTVTSRRAAFEAFIGVWLCTLTFQSTYAVNARNGALHHVAFYWVVQVVSLAAGLALLEGIRRWRWRSASQAATA